MSHASAKAALFGAAGLAALLAAPAHPLSITVHEVAAGDLLGPFGAAAPAPALSGAGSLSSVMEEAARYWENVFLDPGTLSVSYGWGAIRSDVLAATAARPRSVQGGASPGEVRDFENGMVGITAFNPDGAGWFADGDPADESEFGARRVDRADLGGGAMTTGVALDDASGPEAGAFDLFTIALHEIGHALGFFNFGDQAFVDGALSIDGGPFAGATLPLAEGGDPHFGDALSLALMYDAFSPSQRLLASDVDVAAIAQFSGFETVSYEAAARFGSTAIVPLPASGVLLLTGLAIVAAMRRRRR